MKSITEFKREFSRTMRGYAPEEVDAAIEMLVSYGAELESANAEFAEVNDELIAENDALAKAKAAADAAAEAARADAAAARGEADSAVADAVAARGKVDALEAALAAAQAEIASYRDKMGDAKDMLENARRTVAEMKAKADEETKDIRARRTAEETRYNIICRKTAAITEAVRNVWREQIETLDALASMTEPDGELDETPAPPVKPIAAQVKPAPIAEPDKADDTTVFELPKKPTPQRVRRAAMAAAALEADDVSIPAQSARRPEPASAPTAPAAQTAEGPLADIFADAPTQQFAVVTDAPHADGVNVDSVYRAASPAALKTKAEKAPAAQTGTHSFAAVRRSLEEIGAKLKK